MPRLATDDAVNHQVGVARRGKVSFVGVVDRETECFAAVPFEVTC